MTRFGRRNIEIKASCPDLDGAREVARALGAEYRGVLAQIDTYFRLAEGRLKLREIEGAAAELIFYRRENRPGAKESSYDLSIVSDPEGTKRIVASALGVRVVVQKRRELWYLERTRLHLDEVERLGRFFEFEVEVSPGEDEGPRHALAGRLREAFRLTDDRLIAPSYSDLMESAGTS